MVSASPQPSKYRQLRKLLHPTWIAGIVSVGFHGTLFAAGPTFPNFGFDDWVQPELEAERRNVPLVELTAAEQQRLPDFSRSLYSFDTYGDLDALSPLFEKSGTNSSTSEPVPSPLTRPRSNTSSRSSSSYSIGLPNLGIRNPPLPSFPQDGASESNEDLDELLEVQGNDSNSTNESGSEGSTPSSENADEQTEPEAIAPSNNQTDVMSLEETLLAYTFDATGTIPEDTDQLVGDWLVAGETYADSLPNPPGRSMADAPETANESSEATQEAPENSSTISIKEPVELQINHEGGICLTEVPQAGLIGAWVGPEGELLEDPQVLKSTGYSGFNQQAIQQIQTLDFSYVDALTGFQFAVLVNYTPENCVDHGRAAPEATNTDTPLESTPLETEPDAPADAESAETDTAPKQPSKESSEEPESADPSESDPTPTFEALPAPEEASGE